MHPLSSQFAKYCESHFVLKSRNPYVYKSLPICLIDCVYSLRTKYESVTLPIVQRYADAYMNGDRCAEGDTVSALVDRINKCGGPSAFADKVLQNHQKLGRTLIPKEEVLYQLAKYLLLLHIETIEDFRNFESPELLEIVIRAVKGISDAGANYLFMLAGDPDRVKPDVHIHHCIADALGYDASNKECQEIFTGAVEILREKYDGLTVAALDNTIWRVYSKAKMND